MAQLLCAQCGAPLPAEAEQRSITCPYCGVTTVPPPKVVSSVVELVRERIGGGGAEFLKQFQAFLCPRCNTAMNDAPAPGATLRVCKPCGGAWIDPSTLERLRNERDDKLADLARRAIGMLAPKDQNRSRAMTCPDCRKPLQRLPFGDAGDAYDVCAEHGAFFDYQELGAFIAAETERRSGPMNDSDLENAGLKRGWRWPWSS
jgi:Zn-finger nucleic acid-binding protein